jgi:L-serine deaminase
LNQEYFCSCVAETNDLKLLRWVREEKECAWNFRTSGQAAMQGNLDMLKYCCENGCEVDEGTCALAAKNGNLDCLEYLRSKNCPLDERTCEAAQENEHIDVLAYAVKNKSPGFEAYEQFIPK